MHFQNLKVSCSLRTCTQFIPHVTQSVQTLNYIMLHYNILNYITKVFCYVLSLNLFYCTHFVLLCVAILNTSTGSTSLSFMVNDTGENTTYDCWINSTDKRLHRWTQGNITTVEGLDPGTYYNITCQRRPRMGTECQTVHRVVVTSKC